MYQKGGLDLALSEDAQGRQVLYAAERAAEAKLAMKRAGFKVMDGRVVKDAERSAAVFFNNLDRIP